MTDSRRSKPLEPPEPRMTCGPNFFVIGAARAGTTSLVEMLRAHGDIFVTAPKETHFLACAGERPRFRGPGDDVTVNRVAVTDVDPFLALYRGADRCRARGEGSVSTLYYGDRAIPMIERHFPEARLIVTLRDPVERAFSSFQYLRARGFEPCADFDEALDREPERIRGGWQHLWHYTQMGYYARQLEPFLERFGHERVKILFHDDLERDPVAFLAEVATFLRVEPRAPSAVPRVNASGEPQHAGVHRLQGLLQGSARARTLVRAVVPLRVRDRVRVSNLHPVTVPGSARERLRAQFADDLARLRTLVPGRQPAWLCR